MTARTTGTSNLPHVEAAFNNSVNAATELAPNEVHLGRLPRFPITIIERRGASGHQSLGRDHLEYCDLARERQRCAYHLVREHHAISASRIARANEELTASFHNKPRYSPGNWVWVYGGATSAQPVRLRDDDEVVLKSKLSLRWTGSFKILRVGPSASAPDGKPVGEKLLYLELPSGMRGVKAKTAFP